VCPVHRQASGHAYRSVYAGPIGSVVSPLLGGHRDGLREMADLPRASTLCGACHEVCPVDIPIEELLVGPRDQAYRAGARSPATPSMAGWSLVASHSEAWRVALLAGRLLNVLPRWLSPGPLEAWRKERDLPPWRGGAFRRWLQERGSPDGG